MQITTNKVSTNTVGLDFFTNNQYKQLEVSFDDVFGAAITAMKPPTSPCFNSNLLGEILEHHSNIQDAAGVIVHNNKLTKINYLIIKSLTPSFFSMGGDLNQVRIAIKRGDNDWLTKYVTQCVENLWLIYKQKPSIITIALVDGDAVGGGFDLALSADVIIATKGTHLGLPKAAFNLSSSLSTMSFLVRKIGVLEANKICLAQKTFSAEELYDVGLIDVLSAPGEMEQTLNRWLINNHDSHNSMVGISKSKKIINGIKKDELYDMADIWVNSALSLSDENLKRMEFFIKQKTISKEKTYTV